MTDNIKRLMIIDKYNHKSIRDCKTNITYNNILYENANISVDSVKRHTILDKYN
jgi:hypothetical protein